MVHYCNPLLWLEKNEPEFAKAVNDLCAAIRFTNRTTFIVPPKEIRDQFIKLVESGNSDDDDKAQLILSAHLINKQFDINDISSGDIYTSDKNKIQAGKVSSAGVVKFSESSTTLTGAKDGLNRRKQFIVLLASGPIPTNGVSDGPSRRREGREVREGNDGNDGSEGRARRVRKTDGEYEVGGGGGDKPRGGLREVVFASLSTEYKKYVSKQKEHHKSDPPMYMYMVSLLNFLKESHKDVYDAILPIIDLNPFVTAVILLQPYKKSEPYILDDDLISAWGGNKDNYDKLRSDWYSHFVGQPYESRIPKMIVAIDNVRCQILESSSVSEFNKLLVETYNKLYETGKVDGVEVLPDATRKLFKNGYGLMWCDEMRFLLYRSLTSMENGFDLHVNLNKFEAILNYIMTKTNTKTSTILHQSWVI